jgi:hypothetical protein
MRRGISRIICSLFVLAGAGSQAWAAPGGNVNFLFGERALGSDLWGETDRPHAFGVMADYEGQAWPVRLEGGIFVSSATADFTEPLLPTRTEIENRISELAFGLNQTWDRHGRTRPNIGGGLAWVVAGSDTRSEFLADTHDDAQALGVYAHGGMFWRVGATFNLGFDVRLMGTTNFDLFGQSGNAAYGQVGLVFGWGWPPYP